MSAVTTRLADFFKRIFPERQIYVRSAGQVQFFIFGSAFQASLAMVVLLFLGWTAFATVMVIFKDRTTAARDQRYYEVRQAYAERLASLRYAYSDLKATLTRSNKEFDQVAIGLTSKQNLIGALIAHENEIENNGDISLAGMSAASLPAKEQNIGPSYTLIQAANDGLKPYPRHVVTGR